MRTSGMPHGTISPNFSSGSRVTLSANPCQVTQRLTCTPIEAIFRARPAARSAAESAPAGSPTHTPGNAESPDPEARQGMDQRFLDLSQIPVQVFSPLPEIQNRIPHELPGSVVCHVPTPFDLGCRDPGRREQLGSRDEIPLRRAAPERDHRLVLEQQEEILLSLTVDSLPRQASLPRETDVIWYLAGDGNYEDRVSHQVLVGRMFAGLHGLLPHSR